MRAARTLLALRRLVAAVVRRFFADGCLVRASALTYTSLLSIVPLLAFMFSALKGLGVPRRLEPMLLSRLALDPETTARVMSWIDRTNLRTVGTVGAVALLALVLSVLASIEDAFNHIWRVPTGRSLWRRASDYLGAVLVTPFLLLAGVAITSSLHEQSLLRWLLRTEVVGALAVGLLRLAPYAMNAAALALLYALMPNRRPHLRGILVGAVVAGCVWQVIQSSYVSLQIGVARYSAIYGALAQLPVTLVWIYLSWLVVLAGAELAAVVELGGEAGPRDGARVSPLGLALEVLVRAAQSFRDGAGGIDLARIGRELGQDFGEVSEIAERLRAAGLLAAEATSARLLLARDPGAIELGGVARLLERDLAPRGSHPGVAALLGRLEGGALAALEGHTLAELLGSPREAGATPR